MNSSIGFTAIWRGTERQHNNAATKQQQVLSHFPNLEQLTIVIGSTTLYLWGRNGIKESTYTLPDGSLLALVGTPLGDYSWKKIEEMILPLPRLTDFRLPWDGRVILLYISKDGNQWILWNDWLGSIPVYYTEHHKFRIASTVEPIVVTVNEFTPDNFFLPGIVSLLMNGYFLNDWTLFTEMKFILADSITQWDESGCKFHQLYSVVATDDRWETGWDDLVDEIYQLTKKAITDVLITQPSWILPLSSGLDSRLIASVGSTQGVNFKAYTWGPTTTRDAVYSQKIANILGIPWQRIDLGEDYLQKYVKLWASIFGSSMHFHGMYQIPFLETLMSSTSDRIVIGYIGDSLPFTFSRIYTPLISQTERIYITEPEYYFHWKMKELEVLLKVPIDQAFERIADEISCNINNLQGSVFQKTIFLDLWSRQNHFAYFQSMLSDYWFGVATPYINRDYARFCLSLPRALIEDRRLLIEMMRRYYYKVMCIPGTYALEPANLTGSYLLKRRLAKILPRQIASFALPGFFATENINTDVSCMRLWGKQAIWPIPETSKLLGEWMNLDQIEDAYQSAINGDLISVRKLQSIQAFAYRLLPNE